MKLEPSISIHERIYRSLRLRIMFGEIIPGKTFSIRGLASEFSVSMTPIRDATRRLVAEGALTMSPSGRISAPQLNPRRVEELFSIRLLLEPQLALLAVPRVHAVLIQRLSERNNLIEEMIARGNLGEYSKINIEFYKTLYLRAQAPAMLAILETVWLQLGPTIKVVFEKKLKSNSRLYHRHILVALRSGNQEDLIHGIKADIKSGLEIILN